jgi:drug/metabolite transporter (DMT)-like permease
MTNRIFLANAAAAAASLSAGASVVATRLVVGESDPGTLAFYRYVIGVACLVPVLYLLWPRAGLTLRETGKIAILGALFFGLFPWAFNASLDYIPAARGAIGLATIPIQTLIIAVLAGRETLSLRKLVSVGLAFAGVAVAFGPAAFDTDPRYLVGDGLMLLGALSAAVYSVFGRPTLIRHDPFFVTALSMIFGVLALLPLALANGAGNGLPSFTADGWLALLFLGTVGGALQFSLFAWALRWLLPSRTAIYLALNPISAMLLAVLILSESLTAGLIAGLLLVIAALFTANWSTAPAAK